MRYYSYEQWVDDHYNNPEPCERCGRPYSECQYQCDKLEAGQPACLQIPLPNLDILASMPF